MESSCFISSLPLAASLITNTPHQSGTLLQLKNLQGHIVTSQSPQCTYLRGHSCFPSVGCDKHIMTWISHYSIIQSHFSALKIPCVLPVHHFPHSAATTSRYSRFAFSRVSYTWDRLVCNLFHISYLHLVIFI